MARRDDDGKKKEYLATMWCLEQSGALASVGDPIGMVDRVSQETMAGMLGITRSTMNRRIGDISPPSTWDDARRDKMSRQQRRRAELEGKSVRAGERKIRKRIAAIVQHNGGRTESHSYAIPAAARPVLEEGKKIPPKQHAQLLAATFGEKLFDPNMEVDGYRQSEGYVFHPNLPNPIPCECRLGQERFDFVEVCPTCKGAKAHRVIPAERDRKQAEANQRRIAQGKKPKAARNFPRTPDGKCEVVPASLLKHGDHVMVTAGQLVPGDADVVEGAAFIGGVPFKAGRVAREGQRLQSGELKLRIRSTKAGFYLRRVPCERRGCMKEKGKAAHECPRCMGSGEMFEGLPDFGRVLLHFFLDRGIASPDKKGVLAGYTQERIGEMVGLDVSTVRLYEDKLEWLDIIQVIQGEVIREYLGGPIKKRHPHKILYLPVLALDGDRVELEKARLKRAMDVTKPLLREVSSAVFDRVTKAHAALLQEWHGKQHQLQAFHGEMRRRLAAENIHKSVIDALFPLMRI